jgi:hypothetical protein
LVILRFSSVLMLVMDRRGLILPVVSHAVNREWMFQSF